MITAINIISATLSIVIAIFAIAKNNYTPLPFCAIGIIFGVIGLATRNLYKK